MLQQDNISKEIPIFQRIILELDIQGAISSGTFTVARQLLPKIQGLNTIRCILDNRPAFEYGCVISKNLDMFIWVGSFIQLFLQ